MIDLTQDARRPRPDALRRSLVWGALAAPLVAPLAGCGGGGGGGGSTSGGGGGGGGGGTASPTGRVVLRNTSLTVVNTATAEANQYTGASTTNIPGVGVSRNGRIGDVYDYFGVGSWRIAIRALDNAQLADYPVSGPGAFPTSAAVLNADGTILAYSVSERENASSSNRLERTYLYNLSPLSQLGLLDNYSEPAFFDDGRLLVRNGDQLHVFSAQLADQGALPITVNLRFGSYAASPDGRYIAYENGSRIRVFDRNTGTSWQATDDFGRTHYAPVFSPDGQWLALLRSGTSALQYLNVIAFVPGATKTIDDSTQLRSPSGNSFDGTGRIGWARLKPLPPPAGACPSLAGPATLLTLLANGSQGAWRGDDDSGTHRSGRAAPRTIPRR